jgi:hypothetical protein
MKKTPLLTESQKAQVLGDLLANISFPANGQLVTFGNTIQYFTSGDFATHIEAMTGLTDSNREGGAPAKPWRCPHHP